MENFFTKHQSWAPQFRSVLRIVAAFMFIQIGTMKLFGFPEGMPGGKSAELFSEVWFAGFLELAGGAFFLIGLFTRPVAFILAGEMAVAYFQVHAPKSIWTAVNGGASAVLFCFVFFYFSAVGAGPWSVDALRKKKSH